MSEKRSQLRFNIGDILQYDNGFKWKKTGYREWTCIGTTADASYRVGEVCLAGDTSDWIALDFTLISFNNYLNEIESSITDKGIN